MELDDKRQLRRSQLSRVKRVTRAARLANLSSVIWSGCPPSFTTGGSRKCVWARADPLSLARMVTVRKGALPRKARVGRRVLSQGHWSGGGHADGHPSLPSLGGRRLRGEAVAAQWYAQNNREGPTSGETDVGRVRVVDPQRIVGRKLPGYGVITHRLDRMSV